MRSLSSLLLLSLVVFLLLSPSCLSSVRGVGKKLSDKDLQELEDQWFEDEEDDPDDLSRWKKGPEGQRLPPKQRTKSEMAFVNLRKPITKDETSKWAAEKSDLLTSGGVEVKGYSVEAGKVLLVADGGFKDMAKVQRFVLKQDRVVDFEWNQKKSYPQAQKRSSDDDDDEEEEVVGAPVDVEAMLAKAQRQAMMSDEEKAREAKKAKLKQKQSRDDTFLGGAGSPIPADLPDED